MSTPRLPDDPHAIRRKQGARRKKLSVFGVELAQHERALVATIEELLQVDSLEAKEYHRLVRRHPKGTGVFAKSDLILGYRHLAERYGWKEPPERFAARLRMKPVRTDSGVAPVTILTRPFPCPGKCVFCPNDVQMPKSYLAMEPGAQRATQNRFDPYLQTWIRLRAFANNGHALDKIEMIILGGTWSSYPLDYRRWFIDQCLEAMTTFSIEDGEPPRTSSAPDFLDLATRLDGRRLDASYNDIVTRHLKDRADVGHHAETRTWDALEETQRLNESASSRCVGLSLETRPDCVDPDEVVTLRRLGATKIQLGIQSLDDRILELNQRGHDVATARRAVRWLRAAGFKLQFHWMPNLYGADPSSDRADFRRLFEDPDFRPDELKVYPCSLIESAELMKHYEAGRWRPYDRDELIPLLADVLCDVPRWCRVSRVIRDIPSHDIVAGNRTSNLREDAHALIAERGGRLVEIRTRQIRRPLEDHEPRLERDTPYATATGREVFLETLTIREELLGFLRLSLPVTLDVDLGTHLPELDGAAVIREVHVYGAVARIGGSSGSEPQHRGIGHRLLARADLHAIEAGFQRIAVISAIGTRDYYRRAGFRDEGLYLVRDLETK